MVEDEKCVGCGACVEACPVKAIHIDVIAIVDVDKCATCGVCTEACPQFAIKI